VVEFENGIPSRISDFFSIIVSQGESFSGFCADIHNDL